MQPPPSLAKLQRRFGEVLQGLRSPSSFKERRGLEIYRSTYLGNLLSTLKKHFPSLPLLLGESRFEREVGLPYIKTRAPRDWHLERFGFGLTAWLKERGLSSLSPLLLPLSAFDETLFSLLFPKERGRGLLREDLELLESPFPLIEIRKALLAGEALPRVERRERAFVLYSDLEGRLFALEVDRVEGRLLQHLKERGLEEALTLLVQEGRFPLDSLENLLPKWSARWASLQWIVSPQELPPS